MARMLFTLLRYGFTAAGASEAMVSDDALMQIASGLIALACALWGLYESRSHAKLAGEKPVTASNASAINAMIVVGAIMLPALVCGIGCTTTKTTATDGTVSTTKSVDWSAVNVVVKGSSQTATVLILANNDDLSGSFATLNTGIAAIFVGNPTQASMEASIKALNTGLDNDAVTALSGVLMTAYDYYKARTGETTLVADNTVVKGLVTAFTDGVAAGIVLHNSSKSTTVTYKKGEVSI